jgi:hypothetical protein
VRLVRRYGPLIGIWRGTAFARLRHCVAAAGETTAPFGGTVPDAAYSMQG